MSILRSDRAPGFLGAVNDTIRIALIALLAVALAKLVLPKIPGAGAFAAYL